MIFFSFNKGKVEEINVVVCANVCVGGVKEVIVETGSIPSSLML